LHALHNGDTEEDAGECAAHHISDEDDEVVHIASSIILIIRLIVLRIAITGWMVLKKVVLQLMTLMLPKMMYY
jgi:hypothetical protein